MQLEFDETSKMILLINRYAYARARARIYVMYVCVYVCAFSMDHMR